MSSGFGKLTAATALLLFLSGCTTDRYLMVEKKDLEALNTSVVNQGDQVISLENRTHEGFQALTRLNEESTQNILQAITEQVEKPTCPPAPEQPVCKVSDADDDGRADRLKGKVIVGEVEKFYLVGPGLVYDARIDSGAETSSLDARNITRFERDGSNWVRFDVPMPDSDDLVTVEREISRRVKIIQSSADESERRVVVELQFMIGNHRQQAEFTLTNREHLSHAVLVGRNILRDVMLIDVGKEFATELPDSLPEDSDGDES
ncbi:RimK/LysX family protein [Marinobacter sp. ATCH36]|uniref:ATP-dependent zinc protease family protein n=1 Tax=Marinobacter sp. ATCH36 TaxID=2945106 RepID=UPI00202060C7|nr:RimK/LysX family protein [Marinobacter sp. ATCH36]MCL7944004.1 RimK/LysX family protein [Marinobacter sp. ATCH36]